MNNDFQIFDINYSDPVFQAHLSPTKKSKEGLKGILSCIAFNPDRSGIYSVGSFSGGIGLYDERNHGCFVVLDSLIDRKRKGVSSVQFSPCGNYMFSRYRESNVPAIECWDIRNTQKVLYQLDLPSRPIKSTIKQFTHKSNQRLGFAIDPQSGFLAAGFHDGRVGVWDLTQPERFDQYKNELNTSWTPALVYQLDPWEKQEYSLACHSVHFTPDTSLALKTLGSSVGKIPLQGIASSKLGSGLSLVCHFQERVFSASVSDDDCDSNDNYCDDYMDENNKKKRIMNHYSKGLTTVYSNI